MADTMWAIAAVLWIGTGLWRWLGSTEKSASYYMQNHFFMGKMGFLVLILLLEIWPMVTLIRWRIAAGKGTFSVDEKVTSTAARIAGISRFQSLLLLLMLIFAVLMARGYGM